MKFERVPRPEPDPGEVLDKVAAAGVGPWDGWIRSGKSALPQPLPSRWARIFRVKSSRWDPETRNYVLEIRFFGVTNSRLSGAYAEYAVASAGMVSSKPTSLSHVEAASVPVIAVTACRRCLITPISKQVKPWLFMAAGNVGSYAVQLAHLAGVQTYRNRIDGRYFPSRVTLAQTR